jgi:hypothetical protein
LAKFFLRLELPYGSTEESYADLVDIRKQQLGLIIAKIFVLAFDCAPAAPFEPNPNGLECLEGHLHPIIEPLEVL